MHAAGGIGAVIVMEYPPLAGVAAVGNRGEPSKLRRVAAGRDRLNHLCREQAFAVDHPAVQHQLPQTPEVTKTRGHTAAREWHALAVNRLISVLLCAHAAPDPFGGEVGHGLSCHRADHPAQHVRVDRLVVELCTVLASRLDLLEVFPVTVRAIVIFGLGQRAGCCGVEPDIGIGI